MSSLDLRGQTRVLDGNRAGAFGILLSRPDVISSYPITPQTPMLETLYKFEAEGLFDPEMMSRRKNSAMGVLLGACAAGGRTFTATSSQGLSFMGDAYLLASGNRFPIVMALGMREQVSPHGVFAGQQERHPREGPRLDTDLHRVLPGDTRLAHHGLQARRGFGRAPARKRLLRRVLPFP